jgi:transposase
MLKLYKIPAVTHIAVDEVYARKKKKFKDEDRDQRFFTIITDLATHRVIWVAESRKQQALDQFFTMIGPGACQDIKVVATDQHEGYAASVRKNCPSAKLVWDRFHIMQGFGEVVNETRKNLHHWLAPKDPLVRLSQGKYRYIFLKKDSRRTEAERKHIEDIVQENKDFAALEIIKESMLAFFNEQTADSAQKVFWQIGDWINQKCEKDNGRETIGSIAFAPLQQWWNNLALGWDTLKNFFEFRVTSALAEGTNNVIKALKRRSFGFRNMDYFKLKIMQVCGYLNSRYIKFSEALGT